MNKSYIRCCRVCYEAILEDLKQNSITLRNVNAKNYFISRRTIYHLHDGSLGKNAPEVSVSTFRLVAEKFGLTFDVIYFME